MITHGRLITAIVGALEEALSVGSWQAGWNRRARACDQTGVSIADAVPPSVMAALRQGAAAPIAAWKSKVPAEAAAIVDGAMRQ